MRIGAFGVGGEPVIQFWDEDYPSYQGAYVACAAHVVLGAALDVAPGAGSSDSEVHSATSSCLAEKSWAAAGAARAAHRETASPVEALADTDSVDSTLIAAYAAMEVGRKCFGAGHVAKEKRRKRENWIEAYGRT